MSDEICRFSNTAELLAYLWRLDVHLSDDNGRLACKAPKGVLTPDLQRELKSRKREILEILRPSGPVFDGAGRDQFPRRCIHDLFQTQTARTPEALAVVCGLVRLNYAELNTRSNQLANRLRALGVGTETLVGICLDRSPEMVIALLAVLKAGGAYIPMDPQFPAERLALMLEDSRAAVLITRRNLLTVAPPDHTAILCLDSEHELIERESVEPPAGEVLPENLAYVIYTSGSTGRPKGVAVEHRAVVNLLDSMRAAPGISQHDRLLAVTTLSFDIAGLEIYLPLIAGAQLIIAPRTVVADGAALARLLRESETTVMQATPVTWRLLLDSGWDGLPRLKMLCGGEALSRELANRLLATGGELWNLYGPTETTIWSTIHCVDSRAGSVPIGGPIANTQLHVLDDHRQMVPPGVVGELYIGGDGLAREYLRRPELTAERFVADLERPGNRLYRTGDLVRRLHDGNLEFVGRNDQQIKLRGFRIELGEIEAVLERQQSVRQAVVMLREDNPGEQRLIAYMVSGSPGDPAILRHALEESLPRQMIPAAFVFLDAFPLTPNGKVNRKALPAPGAPPRVHQDTVITDNTSTAGRVAAIWRAVLKVPEIGFHDDFFASGGHSLLIVQVQSMIRREFSLEIPIPELFQRPTIAALAELLNADHKALIADDGRAMGVHAEGVVSGQDRWKSSPQVSVALVNGIDEPVESVDRNGAAHQPMDHVVDITRTRTWADGPSPVYPYESVNHPRSCLVRAQPRGSQLPLFLVAGFQGPDDTLLVLSRLIPHLSSDQPVYGLRPRWIVGGELYSSVEEEAREYLAELRAVQPKGPYLLGGYCLSGLVALEMANQLIREGEQVALLALIDTERPTAARTFVVNILERLERALQMVSVLRDVFHRKDRSRAHEARSRIRYKMTLPGKREITPARIFLRTKLDYQRVIREYVAKQYPGRITLIVNEDLYRADRYRGWRGIPLRELVIKKASGDHITMFTEHGQELADLLLGSVDGTMLEGSLLENPLADIRCSAS